MKAFLSIHFVIFLLIAGHLKTAKAQEEIRLPVTRDTHVSSIGRERDGSQGGVAFLKTKSTQEFGILDFDPAIISGKVIESVELHFLGFEKDPQRRLTVSTLASDWVEGTGKGYDLEPGSASFNWAAQNKTPWAFKGSDITAVTFGRGNTCWRFAESTPRDTNGWQSVTVDPKLVAARIAGISHGFVISDDVGAERIIKDGRPSYLRPPNRYFRSREAGPDQAPFFKIHLGEEDEEPPKAIEQIAFKPNDLPAGEVEIKWITPEDIGKAGTIGFLGRFSRSGSQEWREATPIPQYLIPMAVEPGNEVMMHLRDLPLKPGEVITLGLRPVDGAGNLGPITWKQIKTSAGFPPIQLTGETIPAFRDIIAFSKLGNLDVSVVDALDKIHPISGIMIPPRSESYLRANHLWSASSKLIRLQAAKNEFVDFQIILSGQAKQVSGEIKFKAESDGEGPQAEFFRLRHVQTEKGPLPDPLIPWKGPIDIPSPDEKIEGQKFGALVVDIYVPHETTPGLKKGTLLLKSGDSTLSLNIELTVWDFTLPDYLSFIPEMNCYNIDPPEIEYYRLAHAHRTCLNKVPYSQIGKIKGVAPEWNGLFMKWEKYDQTYGPLLDGSAFKDLPRKNVPVDSFYLPFNENWPLKLEDHLKDSYWADEAITKEYRTELVKVFSHFARHFNERKWHNTFFEFFLNNKASKDEDNKKEGYTPWIFDEPQNIQDFWALRWFGTAFHEGVRSDRGQAKMVFRCDLSRPQFQREILDDVLDVKVVGRAFRQYHRMVMDKKNLHGQVIFNYGNSNKIDESNIKPAIWCIDAWCLGMDGVIPWKTTGEKEAWNKGQTEAVFYPPEQKREKIPFPSVRLKAYRRGQQDVEYLTLLTQALKQPRWAVGKHVRDLIHLSDTDDGLQKNLFNADVDYSKFDPVALWQLRTFVGSILSRQKPLPQRRWVDLQTPLRTPKNFDRMAGPLPAKIQADPK